MTAKAPSPDTRAKIEALIKAAAAGQADWLDKALEAAGYIRKADRLSKGDLAAEKSTLDRILAEIAVDCRASCGQHMYDKITTAIQKVEDGGAAQTTEDAPRGPAAPAAAEA
jgi:hypothetical protein